MLKRTTCVIIAAGLLMLALSSPLQALPSNQIRRGELRAESGDFVAAAWKWLVLVFAPDPEPPEGGSSAARSKEGSQLDPDGHH